MREACQCIDTQTGKVGSFLYVHDLKAVSPVFNDLAELFSRIKKSGIRKIGNINHNNYLPIYLLNRPPLQSELDA